MVTVEKKQGNAWVFEGILDVDWEICPFETLRELRAKGTPITNEELGKHCMVKVDPDFPKKVQNGYFIIAGENMGYGHGACLVSLPQKAPPGVDTLY